MKKSLLLVGLLMMVLVPLGNNGIGYYFTTTIDVPPTKESSHFDYTFNSFKHYNNRTDTGTVKLFIEVAKEFDLYADTNLYETCVAQICTESGAKQYYDDSSLVVSSGNAIGFGQIVPTTGFLFLKNVVSKDDEILNKLGGDEFEDIISHKKCNKSVRKRVIKWLSNKRNNIILWGYIMKYCLKKGKTLDESLVVYNQGEGFLRKFLKKKRKAREFKYVNHVRRIKLKLKKLFRIRS